MAYTGYQLWKAIQPDQKRMYNRVFKKARALGYVKNMSLKHKFAVIAVAYRLLVERPASPSNKLENHLLTACKIDRVKLYKHLERGHVWRAGQWLPKWHIESAKEIVGV